MTDQPRLSIIPGWCSTDPRMRGKDLQVLCVLGQNTSTKSGWCRRSQVTMAKQLSCARSTVQASLDRLMEIGAVERHEEPSKSGRDSAYFYRVVYDREPPSGYAFDAWDEAEDEENILADGENEDTPPAGIPAPPAGPGSAPPAGSGPAPINASCLTPAAERIEREGAQARGNDGDGKSEEKHDDQRSLLKRVKAMEIGRGGNVWPGAIGSSTSWTVAQFEKLDEGERLLAEQNRDPYLAICKAQGVKPVALGNYFRDRKFMDVTVHAARAATAKLERVPVKPFGPVWTAMRALALVKGPGQVEMPGDIRGHTEGFYQGLSRFPERAQAYLARKGISLDAEGRLIFPDDFERAEYRRRQCEEGYPSVNKLHKLAAERGHDMTDGRNGLLTELCEPVPVGSTAYEAWRAYHEAMNWPLWPDPGQFPVVWFPKSGPEGMAAFVTAARELMAKGEGGQGDADAA